MRRDTVGERVGVADHEQANLVAIVVRHERPVVHEVVVDDAFGDELSRVDAVEARPRLPAPSRIGQMRGSRTLVRYAVDGCFHAKPGFDESEGHDRGTANDDEGEDDSSRV